MLEIEVMAQRPVQRAEPNSHEKRVPRCSWRKKAWTVLLHHHRLSARHPICFRSVSVYQENWQASKRERLTHEKKYDAWSLPDIPGYKTAENKDLN